MQPKPHSLTLAYAAADRSVYTCLCQHLQPLVNQGLIALFELPQDSLSLLSRVRVKSQLLCTQLYVPLLSPEFTASPARLWQLEQATRRVQAGRLLMAPIIARALDLGATPLARLYDFDASAAGLVRAEDIDARMTELARSIRRGFRPRPRDPHPAEGPTPSPEREPSSQRPTRSVLCLFADPQDEQPLALGREHRAITRALAENPEIEMTVHHATTFEDVETALLRRDYDLVHFAGHHTHERGLTLLDERGQPRPLDGATFTRLLRHHPSIHTLVLNARDTHELGLHAQVERVVAMQGPVDDEAAVRFSSSFYRAIALGRPTDSAFAWARDVMSSSAGIRPLLLDHRQASFRPAL